MKYARESIVIEEGSCSKNFFLSALTLKHK